MSRIFYLCNGKAPCRDNLLTECCFTNPDGCCRHTTMEEYANYGFSVMEDKLNREPNYFFSNRSFLDIFMQLTTCREDGDDETGPESL